MPRPAFKRPYQPKNRKQGGGVPKAEGRPVDVRVQMGEYMAAVVDIMASQDDLSISAWCRDAVRERLQRMGVSF